MKSTVAPYATSTWCVRIVCTGGLTLRLTTYPVDIVMSNDEIYATDSGYEQTAYAGTANMAPSAIDLEGFVGLAGITRDQIASGVFDNARVYIFKCDWQAPVEDYEPVTSGFFGKTTLEDGHYKVEGISLVDALGQSVGQTYTAACSHTFGDAACGKDLDLLYVTGTLTHVTGASVMRDSTRSEALDYFGGGTILFTSGANAGLKPLEIKSYAADGTITTFEPPYYLPVAGDAYIMIPGCRKRLEDCGQKWANVINFFGFTHMPTQSAYQEVGGTR